MQLQHAVQVDVNQNQLTVKIKSQLTLHASYFMNKAFKLQINDLSNFLSGTLTKIIL